MRKHFFVLALITLILGGCSERSEDDYRNNPKALQETLARCPNTQPKGITCENLQVLSENMTALAEQLQLNPQGFGKKILTLQVNLAEKINILKMTSPSPSDHLTKECRKTERELADHLAIVKWLESPVS